MKVTMLKNAQGSENGKFTNSYVEGETYEMSEALAKVFIKEKLAREGAGAHDVKAFSNADYENKALSGANVNDAGPKDENAGAYEPANLNANRSPRRNKKVDAEVEAQADHSGKTLEDVKKADVKAPVDSKKG